MPMSLTMPHAARRLMTLTAMAVAALALFAACSSSDPTPTPPPTSTPSPTPTPEPEPFLDLASDAVWGDFLELLDEEAVSCVSRELGAAAFEALSATLIFGDDLQFEGNFPLACVSLNAAIDLIIAGLGHSAGGISGDTVTCIRQTFGGLDVDDLAALVEGDFNASGVGEVIGATLGLLLCLTDEEAEGITIGGLLGDDSGSGPTLLQTRCILQNIDIDVMIGLFGDSGETPDFNTALDLLDAFSICGLNLDDLLGGAFGDGGDDVDATPEPTISPIVVPDLTTLPPEAQELIGCLQDALGEDVFNQLLAGTYIPTISDLTALGQCDLDLSALSDIGGLLGQ
jgi:hypothetical protein